LTLREPSIAALFAVLALGGSVPVGAQTLPSDPIVLGNGRVTLGGDVSVSFGGDDPGFFNFTDYERSTLRMLRADLTAAVKAGEHLSVLGELRSENAGGVQPYALYARIRPWTGRRFDVQIGRVPPTFGAFTRRTYGADNLLIGYPLGYQYLTSLRPDSLPSNADELLRMRGRGWQSNFSVGNVAPDRGLPLASAFRWDTGVQLHVANNLVDAAVSVTTGTIANPLVGDDNAGKQLAGRIELRPFVGLVVGASGARGPFIARAASSAVAGADRNGEFTQTAWGADVEYSRDYYLVRIETIVSNWRLPIVGAPEIELPLGAASTSVEGRYKIRPGLYVAARADHLGFSEISGLARRASWDAPVTRVEIGGGYSLQRNLLLKLSYQHNTRAGGRVPTLNLGAAQLVYWF
jgi:hypothetical protein